MSEAVELLRFLFTDDGAITIEPDAGLSTDSGPVIAAAVRALAELEPFDATTIEASLRSVLVSELGLKPKLAFGPVRAAITGRRISPPLFESLELLGRDSAMARLSASQTILAGEGAHA